MTPEPENEYEKLARSKRQTDRLHGLLWPFTEWKDEHLSDRDFIAVVLERYKRHWAEHIGDPSR